jgi:hypothetical protein
MRGRVIQACGALAVALAAGSRALAQSARVQLLDGRTVAVRRAATPAFAADAASTIVGQIMATLGLKPNFLVEPVDDGSIANAAAGVDARTGERYVVYNPRFVDALNARTNRWAATLVLAHEVGHSLAGHTVATRVTHPALARQNELEADEFAGGALARLGAPLDSAAAVIDAIAGEDDTPTHPARSARRAALSAGWCRAMKPSTSPRCGASDGGGRVTLEARGGAASACGTFVASNLRTHLPNGALWAVGGEMRGRYAVDSGRVRVELDSLVLQRNDDAKWPAGGRGPIEIRDVSVGIAARSTRLLADSVIAVHRVLQPGEAFRVTGGTFTIPVTPGVDLSQMSIAFSVNFEGRSSYVPVNGRPNLRDCRGG